VITGNEMTGLTAAPGIEFCNIGEDMLPKGRLDCNRFLGGPKVILVFGNDPAGTNNKFVVCDKAIEPESTSVFKNKQYSSYRPSIIISSYSTRIKTLPT
jgi:hypothetical protein